MQRRVSNVGDGAGASQAAPGGERCSTRHGHQLAPLRGQSGDAYRFRITATDRALNSASIVTEPVLVPVDDRDRRLLRLSRGWKRTRTRAAWGSSIVRANGAGATAHEFNGTRIALVGRRLPRAGRFRVTIDGRTRTLRARGRSGHRSVLWVSSKFASGAHTLRLRSLGGGPVELDAVVPSP